MSCLAARRSQVPCAFPLLPQQQQSKTQSCWPVALHGFSLQDAQKAPATSTTRGPGKWRRMEAKGTPHAHGTRGPTHIRVKREDDEDGVTHMPPAGTGMDGGKPQAVAASKAEGGAERESEGVAKAATATNSVAVVNGIIVEGDGAGATRAVAIEAEPSWVATTSQPARPGGIDTATASTASARQVLAKGVAPAFGGAGRGGHALGALALGGCEGRVCGGGGGGTSCAAALLPAPEGDAGSLSMGGPCGIPPAPVAACAGMGCSDCNLPAALCSEAAFAGFDARASGCSVACRTSSMACPLVPAAGPHPLPPATQARHASCDGHAGARAPATLLGSGDCMRRKRGRATAGSGHASGAGHAPQEVGNGYGSSDPGHCSVDDALTAGAGYAGKGQGSGAGVTSQQHPGSSPPGISGATPAPGAPSTRDDALTRAALHAFVELVKGGTLPAAPTLEHMVQRAVELPDDGNNGGDRDAVVGVLLLACADHGLWDLARRCGASVRNPTVHQLLATATKAEAATKGAAAAAPIKAATKAAAAAPTKAAAATATKAAAAAATKAAPATKTAAVPPPLAPTTIGSSAPTMGKRGLEASSQEEASGAGGQCEPLSSPPNKQRRLGLTVPCVPRTRVVQIDVLGQP